MATFETVGKRRFGYDRNEVDAFIARARDQYARPESKVINWRRLASESFTMVRDGYDPLSVDRAIDKLEDTFAERDLKSNAFVFPVVNRSEEQIRLRNLLANRVARAKGKRFERNGVFGLGYSRKAVDAVLQLVGEFLEDPELLEIDDVRELKFKLQRGGYVESQVDAYIDRLVEYIQTQRFSS